MYLGRPDLHHVQPRGYRPEDLTNPAEVNNVDVDLEMAKMAENEIAFNMAVKFIKDRMSDVEASIRLRGI
jgi:flagellar basal-body rod protein FlgB